MLATDFANCRAAGRPGFLAYIRTRLTEAGVSEHWFCSTYATRLNLRPWGKPVPAGLDEYSDAELERLATRADEAGPLWERLTAKGDAK